MMNYVSGNEIAELVLRTFDGLPSKRKPLDRGDGQAREWIPLSGIVAQGKNGLNCISIATGMKCLPQSKIHLAQGNTIHDSHAEILAIRALNRFLLEECQALASSASYASEYLRRRPSGEITEEQFQPFGIAHGLKLHMYCSEAPCGDASMELTMASQDDSTPWAVPSSVSKAVPANDLEFPHTIQSPGSVPSISDIALDELSNTTVSATSNDIDPLPGRAYFSLLSIVRRKPSRPDAPPTLSKSCSDKLALKQSTSLLSSLSSSLIAPSAAYLNSLVLPSSQYSTTACARAFSSSGRLAPLQEKVWEGGYSFRPFDVKTTSLEFAFSRRVDGVGQTGTAYPAKKFVPSNISMWWTPNGQETLIGGSIQGRKQFDPKGASAVCKRRMWRLAVDVAALVGQKLLRGASGEGDNYKQIKEGDLLRWRRHVKVDVRSIALKGWTRNAGEHFMLNNDKS